MLTDEMKVRLSDRTHDRNSAICCYVSRYCFNIVDSDRAVFDI